MISWILITDHSFSQFVLNAYYFSLTTHCPSLSTLKLDGLALSPQLSDDDGQRLGVGAILAQPHADGQGLHVEAGVQEAADLKQGLESLLGVHQAPVAAGSVPHGRETLGHNTSSEMSIPWTLESHYTG